MIEMHTVRIITLLVKQNNFRVIAMQRVIGVSMINIARNTHTIPLPEAISTLISTSHGTTITESMFVTALNL